MTENEIVALVAVLSKVLLELRRGLGLDMADTCSKGVPDSKQALVGAPVPRLVRYRARGQKSHLGAVATAAESARLLSEGPHASVAMQE